MAAAKSEKFCMMGLDSAASHPLRMNIEERLVLFSAQRIPYSILQQRLQWLVDAAESLQRT